MGMVVGQSHEMAGTRIPHLLSYESGKQSPGLGPELLKESGSWARDDRPAKPKQIPSGAWGRTVQAKL